MRTIHRPTWKDVIGGLKILGWAIGIFCAWLLLLWATSADAQTVVRKGNTFYQQPSKKTIQKDSSVTLTQFTYVIKDIKYPVYKSSRGSYFIIRTNKKGEQYRKYVTKEICGKTDKL